jgi:hypothetical protein
VSATGGSSCSTADPVYRLELIFILLFRYLRKLRSDQLRKAAELAASKAKQALPLIVK